MLSYKHQSAPEGCVKTTNWISVNKEIPFLLFKHTSILSNSVDNGSGLPTPIFAYAKRKNSLYTKESMLK